MTSHEQAPGLNYQADNNPEVDNPGNQVDTGVDEVMVDPYADETPDEMRKRLKSEVEARAGRQNAIRLAARRAVFEALMVRSSQPLLSVEAVETGASQVLHDLNRQLGDDGLDEAEAESLFDEYIDVINNANEILQSNQRVQAGKYKDPQDNNQ